MGFDLHERGVPTVDDPTCTACGQCVAVCPDEVLVLRDGKVRPGAGRFMGCIACGHCMAVCPTGAIRVSGRDLRPEDRDELPAAVARASADQLEALLTARRSVRHFTRQPVPRETLERIVRMASTAPMGIPPHEVGVAVFDSPEKVQAFAAEACAAFGKMARFLNPVVLGLMRPLVGRHQYAVFRDFIRPLLRTLSDLRAQGRDAFTHDAPAAMLFHCGPMGDVSDCAIVATYAMLAAESLGLGSCMIGTSVALNRNQALKARYGIPAEDKVGLALALGYPAVAFRHAIRRRLAGVSYVS